ncbi:hypothetical protein QYF61_022812 [Mycteria americana]|uniref:Uncharacterized protein n=1 Tax=Mycteria americana TaxID=33587 RepID=A0AAN7S4B2_MYCAM|nr:hypothetical protein QYF61_022812 [Mycteria americana]
MFVLTGNKLKFSEILRVGCFSRNKTSCCGCDLAELGFSEGLSLVKKTVVKQVVPLQPTEDHSGAQISPLQPVEDPTLQQYHGKWRLHDDEGWKLVTSDSRTAPAPPAGLQLQSSKACLQEFQTSGKVWSKQELTSVVEDQSREHLNKLGILTSHLEYCVHCGVLRSWAPQYKRYEHTGESPAKSHKDYEGTGVPDIWGESERAGTVQPGVEKVQGGSYQCA